VVSCRPGTVTVRGGPGSAVHRFALHRVRDTSAHKDQIVGDTRLVQPVTRRVHMPEAASPPQSVDLTLRLPSAAGESHGLARGGYLVHPQAGVERASK
jgi:hypothetical protein